MSPATNCSLLLPLFLYTNMLFHRVACPAIRPIAAPCSHVLHITRTDPNLDPGTLYYVAYKRGSSAPQAISNLRFPSSGNFSGTLVLRSAFLNASATLCIADGQNMQLYGFLQVQTGRAERDVLRIG